MAKSCVYKLRSDNKYAALHEKLKQNFGYSNAYTILNVALDDRFMQENKNTLKLDAQGVPTYDSIVSNKKIQTILGQEQMLKALNKDFSPVDDTINNYGNLLDSAKQFNTTNPARDSYIAVVNRQDDKLIVEIVPKTQEAIKQFNSQYSAQRLNERLSSIFSSIGVNVGILNENEVSAGRIGYTDFSKAANIARGFDSLIRVANNMEGAQALTEEFSHLIIGIFRGEPLVERSINYLANNQDIVRDILGDDYYDIQNIYAGIPEEQKNLLIAEEALGQVLRDNFLNKGENIQVPLLERVINYIVNIFKRFTGVDIQEDIIDVNEAMSQLAKDVLNGTRKITQDDLISSKREARFNALSDRIQRNIDILQESIKTEVKRHKISGNKKNTKAQELVGRLMPYTNENADTVQGVLLYAKSALEELRKFDKSFDTFDSKTLNEKFNFLRAVRMYTQSYGSFIKSINDANIEENSEEDNMFVGNIVIDDEVLNIQQVISELNNLQTTLARRFSKAALPAFAEFLKPFMGEEIVVPFGKYAGTVMTAETLLKEANEDITFMDRWLDAMGDSSDTLLQLFNAAVIKAKETARLQTIDDIKEIINLRQQVEKLGITSFDWMFERDSENNKTGNYIQAINYGQFEKDVRDLEDRLNEKYGKNPTGEDAMKKIAERDEWYEENAINIFGNPIPKPEKYQNTAYDNLTDTQVQVLQQFLELKNKFDKKYPQNKTALNKAIQDRKPSEQRAIENLRNITSPKSVYENIKASIANSILEMEDDDAIYGTVKTSKTLTNFDGTEFMTLPVLYTTRLRNPNELSTDVFASLMKYAYSANNYEQMDAILTPLEIGRTLVSERNIRDTRGGKQLVENIKGLGIEAISKVYVNKSNIEARLDDFFASQVYGRYLQDEGTFEVFGKQVSKNKLYNWILSKASMAQLGFNWLANMANVTTGLAMQNIEAFCHEHFSPKDLLYADKEYGKLLISKTAELGARNKTNKLDLFDELFNIRQNFESNVKHATQKKNLLQRLFGAEIAFLGQDAGDHWMYNRTAIAMAHKERVLLNGKEMSLWEALQVKPKYANSEIMELNYRDIKNLDGSNFDVSKFSRKIAHINQSMFGIYNEEDSNAANRVALGRALQQYRKWMKAQFNKRFMAAQYSVTMEQFEEGYYRTFGRVLNELIRGNMQFANLKNELSDSEKANIRRVLIELTQWFAVWGLANLFDWPDDDDKPWTKYAEYAAKRLNHELGALTPTLAMPEELYKTVKTPMASWSVVGKMLQLIASVIDPRDWNDEIKSGTYKGMSTLEKNILQAPIPIIMQYKQMDRFFEGIDTSIEFYARSSY